MRKFAKVTMLTTAKAKQSEHLSGIGPEPLEKAFTLRNSRKAPVAAAR